MPAKKAATNELLCNTCKNPMTVGRTKRNAPYFVCLNQHCLNSKPKYKSVKGVLAEPSVPVKKVTNGDTSKSAPLPLIPTKRPLFKLGF